MNRWQSKCSTTNLVGTERSSLGKAHQRNRRIVVELLATDSARILNVFWSGNQPNGESNLKKTATLHPVIQWPALDQETSETVKIPKIPKLKFEVWNSWNSF